MFYRKNNIYIERKIPNDLCLFRGCNLKSINNYDFCYQHIDLFVKNTCQKYTVCKWRNNKKKCNQLVLKNETSENEFQELCLIHASLAKYKPDQISNKKSSKVIDWKENDEKFNEIENSLRNKNDNNNSDDEDTTDNLLDIDSEPEFLNFSNDSSDQLMYEIIKQHSVEKSNYQSNEQDSVSTNEKRTGLDLSKKTTYNKNELIKIYKLKLSKLKLMYRKQLKILNDKLITDRKKYLEMTKNQGKEIIKESFSNSHQCYRGLNHIEAYTKQKYDPKSGLIYKSDACAANSSLCKNKCIFTSIESSLSCNQSAVPQSKFCQYHIGFDSDQFGFCNCSLISGVENHGIKLPLIRDVIHKCENIDGKSQNYHFELMQEEICIPEHLIEIHKKFIEETKKEDVLEKNALKNEKNQDDFSHKFNSDNLTSEANTMSRETESTVSSSTDSSTTTTSADSNMSVLSSSSSSSTDLDQVSDAENN